MRRIFVALALALTLGACEAPTPDRPPNLVLIFADDVGYADLSSYGHPTIRTPVLDGMAAAGFRLTSFYAAAPACSPSRASILTGRYPVRAGVANVYGPDNKRGLEASEITIAEILSEQGYRTSAIGKWHLGSQPGFMAVNQGFDEYFGLLYSNDMIPPWVNTERPLELYRDSSAVEPVGDQSMLTTRYTEEAVSFIQRSAGDPFFLYLAHSMAHVPLYVNPEREGTSDGGRYGDVMEEIDWSTGEVLRALEAAGVSDQTLVVFTSDNGPWMSMPARMFGDSRVREGDHGNAGGLRGSKATTWEGGHRVPFIAYWPGRIPAGRSSPVMAHTMDVFTTLATLGGGSIPDDRVIDGRDLWPLLTEGIAPPAAPFFYQYPRRVDAVRDGDWKLHIRPMESVIDTLLFDLASDPFERWNLAAKNPEVVSRLAPMLEAFAEEVGGTIVR